MPDAGAVTQLRAAAPTISVGVLSADLTRLGEETRLIEQSGAAVVHFDIMDGCFCPMMTVGPPVVKAVKTPLLKDVHLMVADPLQHVVAFVGAGADIITFHVEATNHPHRVLQVLGSMANANDAARGIVRGIALNPGTPVSVVEPLLGDLEFVLVLAVNPGWGGQGFIRSVGPKVAAVRHLAEAAGTAVLIGIDGGITQGNIQDVAELGADLVVAGSAVYEGGKPVDNLRAMSAQLKSIWS